MNDQDFDLLIQDLIFDVDKCITNLTKENMKVLKRQFEFTLAFLLNDEDSDADYID